MPQQQGLLKRNPNMTREQFSEAWLRHGAIVTPYFLSYGFEYYAQIHAPLQTKDPVLSTSISSWDGAAESHRPTPSSPLSEEEEAWRSAYYHDIILPDERRFLVSEALEHMKVVEGVTGDKKVVIWEGRGVLDVPEDIMTVWKSYEARGKTAEV